MIVRKVVPQSVRLATTFTVPGVGRFQLWIALSRPKGWLCKAIRQPDGTWAALPSGDGRYFAIVIPQDRPGFRLATLDAAGRVLVTDRFDTGH